MNSSSEYHDVPIEVGIEAANQVIPSNSPLSKKLGYCNRAEAAELDKREGFSVILSFSDNDTSLNFNVDNENINEQLEDETGS